MGECRVNAHDLHRHARLRRAPPRVFHSDIRTMSHPTPGRPAHTQAAEAAVTTRRRISARTGDPKVRAWSPCFAAGTRITTIHGDIAVEALRVGDTVLAVLGDDTEPIIWIGRRLIDCARHPRPHQVWPVCISSGAFGFGLPHTDLLLSPDHAVYINKVLIPVKHLINGGTIAQTKVDQITYYHIELRQHDIVLAHGLSVESFLGVKDRTDYANGDGPVKLHPDFSSRVWRAQACAPLVMTGPELVAARAVVSASAAERSGVA